MLNQDQIMETQEQKEAPAQEMERTRSRRRFIPKTDIFETEKEIVALVDIPGASEKSVDVSLEKNVLSITAYIEPAIPSGFEVAYAEYEEGDYQRNFQLPNEIDRDKIEATVSDGVLRLVLPKAESARTRKVTITTN
jgi:HSP20 family molecular chaperone IbpA